MKKAILAILCTSAIALSLASCGIVNKFLCKHIDADGDSLCDNCGEAYTEGVVYELLYDETCYIVTGYTGTATDVKIAPRYNGKPVKVIGDWAFEDCTGLTSVTIPNSVTSIGGYAFSGCTGLASLTIGNGVTSIGNYAFLGCTDLTSVTIPDSVTRIAECAFSGCTGLASLTIGNGVTSIGNWAFSGCTGLTSITIPDSVMYIGGGVFAGCTGLASITVDADNPAYKSVDGNLYTKDEKNLVQYARGNTAIEFTIPDGVTRIGYQAFSGCTGLTSVIIPDGVTRIDGYAFYNCAGLTSATIPDSVMEIGEYAFFGCIGFESVTIPDSVTYVGDRAFAECDGLKSVTIGSGVKSIGVDAFLCSGIMSITVDADNPAYKSVDGNLYTKDGKTLIWCTEGKSASTFVIPDGVTSIGDYAFYYCTSLTSVTIPDSVESIGDFAFNSCYSLTDIYYTGSEAQWTEIDGVSVQIPSGATVHYNY